MARKNRTPKQQDHSIDAILDIETQIEIIQAKEQPYSISEEELKVISAEKQRERLKRFRRLGRW